MKYFTIAIDGTSASGKGTLANLLARHYGLEHIDTGAMYRAVALLSKEASVLASSDAIVAVAENLDIHFQNDAILISDRDVTLDLRTEEISMLASKVVATNPDVRKALVEKQRAIAKTRGVVMDGRDIGSVVLPDATFKFFVDASSEARAKRRFLEQTSKGLDVSFEAIKEDIEVRDKQDYERAESPLIRVLDAHYIDTSNMRIEEVLEAAIQIIERGSLQ